MNLLFKQKKLTQLLIPFILLVLGLYLMPIKIFETDFSKIPGDYGDARFNNYILEHGHKYITGQIDKYWDAPFMYPYPNVIAFSDNLLGTVPVYSLFRILGNDRETALQFWLLTMFALNFICCFWVVNKWSGNNILAATGAYIFAFSIFNLGHIYNVQNFPRFISPFVFYWAWKYLSQKEIKYFLFTMLGVVFQFYCGIYLGFFLVYSLLFLFISYAVVYKDWKLFTQFKNLKKSSYHIGTILLAGLLFYPLIHPYLEIAKKFGMRNFNDVVDTIPTLRSYFFTSKAPVIWQGLLSEHGVRNLPVWWCHFLFMGALPWIGIALVPVIFFLKKSTPDNKKIIAFLSLALFLNFIFCLNINGFTLYKYIFTLPGFSSMRSINRVINTEVIYFALIFVFVFNELSKQSKAMKYVVFVLPLLIVVDNLIDPTQVMRFDKKSSQQDVAILKDKILHQNKNRKAIAYLADDIDKNPINTNLSVMLASQDLNIPCVNAYSGSYPGEYIDFFGKTDKPSLLKWLNYNQMDTNQIQNINDFDLKEGGEILIQLKGANNKYLCDDGKLNNTLIANREEAQQWETFTLLFLGGNKCAIRTYNNYYFSDQLTSTNEIVPNRTAIGEWETFYITTIDGFIVFKAANGKYISLDEKTLQLFARGEGVGNNEKFKLIQVKK